MRVVVDTCVWSLFLRRRRDDLSATQRALILQMRDWIVFGDAILLGIVRQELLTGLADLKAFESVRDYLHVFDDVPPEIDDYDRAAEFANACIRAGIAPSLPDMLICAVAAGRELPILTTDADFPRYARHLPIQLHRLT